MDDPLSSLWQTEPLCDNIDRITPFVNVSSYYKLRLCGHSDTLTDVHVEWSYDGISKCLTSAIKIGSGLWRSEEVKVLMPYLRLHVINSSGKINNDLKITVHNFGMSSSPAPKAVEIVREPEVRFDVVEIPTPVQEPAKKRAWLSKKLSSSPKHTCRDDRLPGFLPMNSVLLTDRRGSIVPLAPGNVGDVLTIGANGPQWISVRSDATEFT